MNDLSDILQTAIDAAYAAGAVLREQWASGEIHVNQRERHDVKLTADVEAEAAIFAILHERRPTDGIVSEEFGLKSADPDSVWVVDPLDGTVNFSHGHPHFATSIAWLQNGQPVVGVIYDPLRDELFTAVRGEGAYLNGIRIHVSEVARTELSMLAVGFSKLSPEIYTMQDLTALAGKVQKLRISGSAALDIAYTACGRLEGYSENSIYLWDIAAGQVIAQEAGGVSYIWQRAQQYQCGALVTVPSLGADIMDALKVDIAACVANLLDLSQEMEGQ